MRNKSSPYYNALNDTLKEVAPSWEDQFFPDPPETKKPKPIGSCAICGDPITSGRLCNRCKFVVTQNPNTSFARKHPEFLETKVPYRTGLEPLPGESFDVSGEGMAPLDKQEVDIMAGGMEHDTRRSLPTYGPDGRLTPSFHDVLKETRLRESAEDDFGDVTDFMPPRELKVWQITTALIEGIDEFAEVYDSGDAESGPSMSQEVSKKTIQQAADKVIQDFGIDYETIEWALQYARRHGIQPDRNEEPLNMMWIERAIRELAKKRDIQAHEIYEGADDFGDVGEYEEPGDAPQSVFQQLFGELSPLARDLAMEQSGAYGAGQRQMITGVKVDPTELVNKYLTSLIDEVGMDPLTIEALLKSKVRPGRTFDHWREGDDFGDVSDFEEPPIRQEEIQDIWDHLSRRSKDVLLDPAPDGVVAADANDSIDEELRRLIALHGRNWDDIEMALVDRYNRTFDHFLQEDINGLGDVGDFEEPRNFEVGDHVSLQNVDSVIPLTHATGVISNIWPSDGSVEVTLTPRVRGYGDTIHLSRNAMTSLIKINEAGSAGPTLGDMRKGNAQAPLAPEPVDDSQPIPPPPDENEFARMEQEEIIPAEEPQQPAEDLGGLGDVGEYEEPNRTPEEGRVIDLYQKYYPQMGSAAAINQVSDDLHFPYAAVFAIVTSYENKFNGQDEDAVPAQEVPHTDETIPNGYYESQAMYRKVLRETIEDFGDVSGFEDPGTRYQAAVEVLNNEGIDATLNNPRTPEEFITVYCRSVDRDVLTEKMDEVTGVLEEHGFNIEDIDAITTGQQDSDLEIFLKESVENPVDKEPPNFAQSLGIQSASEGTGIWESVDDFGDVGDFEEPPLNSVPGQRVVIVKLPADADPEDTDSWNFLLHHTGVIKKIEGNGFLQVELDDNEGDIHVQRYCVAPASEFVEAIRPPSPRFQGPDRKDALVHIPESEWNAANAIGVAPFADAVGQVTQVSPDEAFYKLAFKQFDQEEWIPKQWLKFVISTQNKDFAPIEEGADDLGDVGDFEEPVGFVGQHVRIQIPHKNWDEADAETQRAQGRCGVILQTIENEGEGYPTQLLISLDETNGEGIIVPRSYVQLTPDEDKELLEAVDDLGDVGDFEEPEDEIEIRIIHDHVNADFDMFPDSEIEYASRIKSRDQIEAEQGDNFVYEHGLEEGKTYFEIDLRDVHMGFWYIDTDDAEIVNDEKLSEATDDFGDVGDFEEPMPAAKALQISIEKGSEFILANFQKRSGIKLPRSPDTKLRIGKFDRAHFIHHSQHVRLTLDEFLFPTKTGNQVTLQFTAYEEEGERLDEFRVLLYLGNYYAAEYQFSALSGKITFTGWGYDPEYIKKRMVK